MMRYGLPYMGSKNKIAQWVLSYLPKAENFYDLFCVGCAITHCAITQKKYNNFYINDIKGEMPQGFIDCINGKYNNDYRWISHDDFDKLKGRGDLLVDCCFSFGNNWIKGYAYSKELEPYKKALHYALFYSDFTMSKELYGVDFSVIEKIKSIEEKYVTIKKIIKSNTPITRIQIENMERLLHLERLNRLSTLQMRRSEDKSLYITATGVTYHEVEIKPNSVVYCDIPYRSTSKYNEIDFDYDKFYEWCLSQKEPVFISEYEMPKDFICIAAKHKTVSLCATDNSGKSVERIFIPKHQIKNKPLTLFD